MYCWSSICGRRFRAFEAQTLKNKTPKYRGLDGYCHRYFINDEPGSGVEVSASEFVEDFISSELADVIAEIICGASFTEYDIANRLKGRLVLATRAAVTTDPLLEAKVKLLESILDSVYDPDGVVEDTASFAKFESRLYKKINITQRYAKVKRWQ